MEIIGEIGRIVSLLQENINLQAVNHHYIIVYLLISRTW